MAFVWRFFAENTRGDNGWWFVGVRLRSLSIRPSYGAGGEEILDGGGGRGRRDRKA